MATQAQNLQALQLLRDETQATLVSGANLSGPGLSALLVRLMNIMSEEVQRGGTVRYGVGAPAAALGSDNDVYTDTATGYEYLKVGGQWQFQFNKKGNAGRTPVKGKDYVDGEDGIDGNVIVDKGYAPTTTDNAGYQEGDQWFHTKSTSAYDRYAHISGQWRLVFSSGAAVVVTPTPSTLTAGLTLSTASITTGTALTFTASASGGTSPYTYLTQATNTATGGVINLGSAASGSWTPQAAGTFDITTTVTDSAGVVKISPVRQVSVTAATVQPTAPAAVTQLDVTPGNGQATVNLEAPAANGAPIQSYRYEYRAGTSGTWLIAGTTANLTYTYTGLTNGTSYQFRAFATNSAGTSAAGSVVTATPAAPPVNAVQLSAPAGGTATAVSASQLNVTGNAVANATGYKLYRSTSSTGTYTQVGSTLATPSYADTGRAASTTYYYKWQAVGNGTTYTDSALSASFSGTTQAGATPTYSAATLAHRDRVTPLGYTNLNLDRIEEAYALATSLGVESTLSNTRHWAEPYFGVKLGGGGIVLNMACLYGNDVNPASGGNGPVYEPTGLNGNPRLVYSGATLVTPNTMQLGNSPALTIAMLADPGTVPAAGDFRQVWANGGDPNNTNSLYGLVEANGSGVATLYGAYHSRTGATGYTTRNETTTYAPGNRLIVQRGNLSGTATMTLRVNGQAQSTANDLNGTAGGGWDDTSFVTGGRVNEATGALTHAIQNGHITPRLVLPIALTDVQCQQLENLWTANYLTASNQAQSSGNFNTTTFQ